MFIENVIGNPITCVVCFGIGLTIGSFAMHWKLSKEYGEARKTMGKEINKLTETNREHREKLSELYDKYQKLDDEWCERHSRRGYEPEQEETDDIMDDPFNDDIDDWPEPEYNDDRETEPVMSFVEDDIMDRFDDADYDELTFYQGTRTLCDDHDDIITNPTDYIGEEGMEILSETNSDVVFFHSYKYNTNYTVSVFGEGR